MAVDIIHSRMLLLVGEVYLFREDKVDIALATIPIHTSNKREGI